MLDYYFSGALLNIVLAWCFMALFISPSKTVFCSVFLLLFALESCSRLVIECSKGNRLSFMWLPKCLCILV